MANYTVKKSDGHVGWEWHCPKGFKYFNFASKEAAEKDAEETLKGKA